MTGVGLLTTMSFPVDALLAATTWDPWAPAAPDCGSRRQGPASAAERKMVQRGGGIQMRAPRATWRDRLPAQFAEFAGLHAFLQAVPGGRIRTGSGDLRQTAAARSGAQKTAHGVAGRSVLDSTFSSRATRRHASIGRGQTWMSVPLS
jgi:hypothetical protein